MKIRYLIDKSKCECSVVQFFKNAAEAMGVTVTDETRYDCRKIYISDRVLDCIWRHYYKCRGYRNEEIVVLQATIKDDSYCFEVEEGFIMNDEKNPSRKRLRKLYRELDTLSNNAPTIEDCTDKENDMYYKMMNLKDSISEVLGDQL